MECKTTAVDKIEADSIIIEITDKYTRKVYRRDVPIRYLEMDNGIVLIGEDIEGRPSHINLLSGTALEKINALIGKGPDQGRCGSEK